MPTPPNEHPDCEDVDGAIMEATIDRLELEAVKLRVENATLRDRIAELETDRRIAAVLERIAKAHGIQDPHQLIGMAENDEENYAEILARYVEKRTAPKDADEKAKD